MHPGTLTDLKPGDHVCCLYRTPQEHRAALVPFVRHGLAQGERVLYIADIRTAEHILNALRDAGLDTEPILTRGQLLGLTYAETYAHGGVFDPERMLNLLRDETTRAQREGYAALRVTSEMTWALGRLRGSERLIEYEAKLNAFLAQRRCLLLCQYDLRRFTPDRLLDLPYTHPLTLTAGTLYPNAYYIPPDEFLSSDRSAAKLAHWIENLAIYQRKEKEVQQYADRLSKLRQVGQVILTAQSPEEIAEIALRYICQTVSCEQASLMIFDLEKDQAILIAHCPGAGSQACLVTRTHLSDMDLSQELQQRKARVIDDVQALHETPSAVQKLLPEGLRAYVSVPLIAQEQLLGFLYLGDNRPATFSPQHVEVACEMADSLAIAIQQNRLTQEQARHAAELEARVTERTIALKAANRRHQEIAQRLQAANAELKSFTFTVTHDLRAPLRAMESFAHILLKDYAAELDESGGNYARSIVQAARRMDTLIQDLLAYSRLTHAEIRISRVSLDWVLEEAVKQLQAEIQAQDAQLTIEGPLPQVMGHHRTLVQIVSNLLANAIKFVAPDVQPQVRVWAEETPAWVRLWVQDNGIGIAPENQQRIYQVFERLHGIENYPGTGIGLSIVQKGIERMGGRLGVESQVGQGSQFWVALPPLPETP